MDTNEAQMELHLVTSRDEQLAEANAKASACVLDHFNDSKPISDPDVDRAHALGMALATVAKLMSNSNYRIVRQKVKAGGQWYNVEIARV